MHEGSKPPRIDNSFGSSRFLGLFSSVSITFISSMEDSMESLFVSKVYPIVESISLLLTPVSLIPQVQECAHSFDRLF